MKTIQEDIIPVNGYQLHVVPNSKFKTISMVVKFKAPLEKDTITMRALLPYLLQQGTKNYPSRTAFQKELNYLYGAVLSIDGAKKGENHIISFRLEVANDKFIPSENGILKEAIKLLNEIICHPNVTEDGFEPDVFAREKQGLKKKMHAIIDDKMQYANMRLIDEMCEGEAYQLHVYGDEADLEQLDEKTVYQYYKKMLEEDQIDFYLLGDLDGASAEQLVASNMELKSKYQPASTQAVSRSVERESVQEVIDHQDIQQAKLHIGYRTNCTYRDEDYDALQVFNGLFGGFPSSKLFLNVREKNSLAYYASSRMESHKGLLLVFSGIAPADYEKARNIIEEQMTAMKQGDFSETEMNEIKDLTINQLLETLDNPQGIIEVLYQQVIGQRRRSPDQLLAGIRSVTKEEVVNVANRMQEDTVYLLTTKGGAEVE